jgi:predicted RNase H-like HicB family nuclease
MTKGSQSLRDAVIFEKREPAISGLVAPWRGRNIAQDFLVDEGTPLMATRTTAVPERGPFTAVLKQDGPWWIGWVEEIPGVNSQAHTRDELIENLRSALSEALEMNRAAAVADVTGAFEEVRINP